MDSQSALSIFAEVAVAIAGFSGIVIALGGGLTGTLTALQVRRLSNLFILSGLVLILSLSGIAALQSGMDEATLFRFASALLFLTGAPWLAWDIWRLWRLESAEKSRVNPLVLGFFNVLAIAAIALQLVNWLWIQAAWPFFAGMVVTVMGAFQQFILLVQMRLTHSEKHDA